MSEGSIKRDYGLLLRVTDDWDDSFRYQPRAGYRCTVNTGRDGKADSTLSIEALREAGAGRRWPRMRPRSRSSPGRGTRFPARRSATTSSAGSLGRPGCWAASGPSTILIETATSPPGTTKTTRAHTGGATCASTTCRRPPPAASAARASLFLPFLSRLPLLFPKDQSLLWITTR